MKQHTTTSCNATLTTGEQLELAIIGRVVRLKVVSPRLMLLEYWPVEWVSMRTMKCHQPLAFWQNSFLTSIILLITLYMFGGIAAFYYELHGRGVPMEWLIPYMVPLCVALILVLGLAVRWHRQHSAIEFELRGNTSVILTLPCWLPDEADTNFWKFIELLKNFRTQPTDLTYNDLILPMRFSYETRVALLLSIPASSVPVVLIMSIIFGSAMRLLLSSLQNMPITGIPSAPIYLLAALLGIGLYLQHYVYPDFRLQMPAAAVLRSANRAIRRFEPEQASKTLQAWRGSEDSIAANELMITAFLMQLDAMGAFCACNQLRYIDDEAADRQREIIQAYLPLIRRAVGCHLGSDSPGAKVDADDYEEEEEWGYDNPDQMQFPSEGE